MWSGLERKSVQHQHRNTVWKKKTLLTIDRSLKVLSDRFSIKWRRRGWIRVRQSDDRASAGPDERRPVPSRNTELSCSSCTLFSIRLL